MKRFFTRSNWKGLVSAIVAVLVFIGIVAGVAALVGNDTKTISSSAFSVGGLDSNGKYVSTNKTIVTKNAFECVGLRVEPDFDSNVTYDVYYYDFNGKFIESKLGLTEIYDEDYPLAKLARIVIHPEIPEDTDLDDFKIRFWEVGGIANGLKITVNKDQDYKYESGNLFNESECDEETGFEFNGNTFSEIQISDVHTFSTSCIYENYDIYVRVCAEYKDFIRACVVASDGAGIISKTELNTYNYEEDAWVKLSINLKSVVEGSTLNVMIGEQSEVYIFGYNE